MQPKKGAAGRHVTNVCATGRGQLFCTCGAPPDRGLAHDGKGEYEQAIADFDQALKFDPDFALARQNRERVQAALAAVPTDINTCNKGVGDDRIAACGRVLKRNPAYTAAYLHRGVEYVAKGENDHAVADFDEVIRRNPKAPLAYRGRGLAFRDKGEYDRAIADFDQVILLDPKNARLQPAGPDLRP
jgi:tetratricopeptide (TPR) repeat protein